MHSLSRKESAHLGKAIRNAENLKELDLSGAGINVADIVRIFSGHPTLQILNLSNNPVEGFPEDSVDVIFYKYPKLELIDLTNATLEMLSIRFAQWWADRRENSFI